jgi:uncharacterized protein YdhG (YjbR/CyaY superfamily)
MTGRSLARREISYEQIWHDAVMSSADIDRYLAALDEPKRSTLEETRRHILEVVPGAEQCISYAVPAFRVQGKVVAGFAAFKNHLSYLPHSGSVLTALREELGGYEQTKSALHFAVDQPLPRELIARLVNAKLQQLGLATSP